MLVCMRLVDWADVSWDEVDYVGSGEEVLNKENLINTRVCVCGS